MSFPSTGVTHRSNGSLSALRLREGRTRTPKKPEKTHGACLQLEKSKNRKNPPPRRQTHHHSHVRWFSCERLHIRHKEATLSAPGSTGPFVLQITDQTGPVATGAVERKEAWGSLCLPNERYSSRLCGLVRFSVSFVLGTAGVRSKHLCHPPADAPIEALAKREGRTYCTDRQSAGLVEVFITRWRCFG